MIAPGTYTGSGNCDIDFGGRTITIRSTDPSSPAVVQQTIIDCGGSAAEPHRAFAFHTGETSASIVAGLTIVNAYSPGEAWTGQTRDSGGAIYIDSASPVIQDCTIRACQAGTYGGAIYCRSGSPTLLRCTFRNCGGSGVTGGAVFGDTANANVSSCSFTGNSALSGGAIAFSAGRPCLSDCTFDGNNGQIGGALDARSCTLSASGCTFVGNSASDIGGAIHGNQVTVQADRCILEGNRAAAAGGAFSCQAGSSVAVTSSLLVGNQAGQGGAICGDAGSVNLTNCTLSGNSADSQGGGVSAVNACTVALGNTILWGDAAPTGPEIALQGACSLAVSYSDVQGDWQVVSCPADCMQAWGDGCLASDPLFVDANGPDNDPATFGDNDYRLQPDSPCMHTGNPNLKYSGKTDLAGQLRVLGPQVDIGAYEATAYYLAFNINQSQWSTTIQGAIDAASPNDEVVLSVGTHSGPGNCDLDFHGKAMTLRSSDPADPAVVAATIIQCGGASGQPHRGFVFRSGEGAGTVVSGLTITGGYAPVETIGGVTNAAGGAWCAVARARQSAGAGSPETLPPTGGAACSVTMPV